MSVFGLSVSILETAGTLFELDLPAPSQKYVTSVEGLFMSPQSFPDMRV